MSDFQPHHQPLRNPNSDPNPGPGLTPEPESQTLTAAPICNPDRKHSVSRAPTMHVSLISTLTVSWTSHALLHSE